MVRLYFIIYVTTCIDNVSGVKLEKCATKVATGRMATKDKYSFCEKIADYAATLGVYELALKYYKKMV